MRFKAKFTADGTDQLEKRFLPAMEKFGKTIQVLLSEEEVKLVQTPLDTDGAQVMASFPIEALFDRSSYRCTSRHHNLIAFVADVGLLLKVIRTAAANVADEGLEVKLSQKEFQVTGTEESEAKPFLVFKGEGQTMSILQELPISKPYTAEEIDHLVNLATTASLAPYYVDVGPCSTTLLAMIDRMKSVSGTLMMATCKNGDVHVNVRAINVVLGTQMRELSVYPIGTRAERQISRNLPSELQLEEALEAKEGSALYVQHKLLSRALTVAQTTRASQILCGISEQVTNVHFLFVFKNAGLEIDNTSTFNIVIPSKDDE